MNNNNNNNNKVKRAWMKKKHTQRRGKEGLEKEGGRKGVGVTP
jgi:hypothetical protein